METGATQSGTVLTYNISCSGWVIVIETGRDGGFGQSHMINHNFITYIYTTTS